MSDYYQRNLEHVKRAMTSMELKKKSKNELIELANILGTQTMGTKESLITTMAMKITSMLLQNGAESYYFFPSSRKYTVDEYMMLPALRLMPENSKEFLRQVIRNYKKELRETTQQNVSLEQPSIPVPKPMMSFNPTFQNYNFIPFFQSNMNFNGANNYLSQMMGQQPMMATAVNPYMGQIGHPYSIVGGPQPIGVIDPSGQPTYPYMFSNNMMGKQPQLIPVIQTNPLQISTATTVDQRMVLSNPAMNPLLFNSQARTLNQSSVTHPYPTKKPAYPTTTNTIVSSKKLPLQLTSTSISSVKRDWPYKSSEQITHPPEMKCVCNGSSQSAEQKSSGKLICQNCKGNFHEECLFMTLADASEKECFECPTCTLRTMSPLVEVCSVLKYYIINFEKVKDKCFLTTIKLDRRHFDMQEIDIRLIKLDGQNHYDITWPDHAIVRINDEVIQEFRPLQYLSSVKKRKDSSLLVDPNTLKKYNSMLTLRIDVKTIGKDQQKNYRVSYGNLFALGVYVVTNVNADNYVKQVRKCELNVGRKFIQDTIARASSSEVECHKLSISINDPYNLYKIRLPARGKYCQHAQCFSLDTFVLMMSSTLYPNWRCPVCKRRCFSMYVDTFMLSIIQEAKNAGDLAEEVSFDATGGYYFTKQVELIDLDADPPQVSQGQSTNPIANKP